MSSEGRQNNARFTIHDSQFFRFLSSVILSEASKTRSRKISTLRGIHPYNTSLRFAASEGRNLLQSFARGGCGLPGVRRRDCPEWMSCGFRMVCAVDRRDPRQARGDSKKSSAGQSPGRQGGCRLPNGCGRANGPAARRGRWRGRPATRRRGRPAERTTPEAEPHCRRGCPAGPRRSWPP